MGGTGLVRAVSVRSGSLGGMASPSRSTAVEAVAARPGGTARSGRRRRPTGAAPPLPRNLGWTTISWAVLLAVVVASVVVATRWDAAGRAVGSIDAAILRAVAEIRTPTLTSAARAVDSVSSGWWLFVVAIALLVVLIAMRRWQHLFAFLGSVLVVEAERRPHPRRAPSAAAVRRHDHRRLAGLLPAVGQRR